MPVHAEKCNLRLTGQVFSKRQMSPPPGETAKQRPVQAGDPVWVYAFGAWRQGGIVTATPGTTMSEVEYVRSQTGTLATRKFHNFAIHHRTG